MGNTHIGFVLDMSGSMSATVTDTKGGVASYIDKTKEEIPEARFNLTVFDTVFERWVDNVPLRDLDGKTVIEEYWPRGATALYDAIGDTIKRLKKVVKKDDKAIVVIMTDGLENSSKKYRKNDIVDKITKLTKKGNWTFLYLGANIDAMAEGTSLGIFAGNTYNFSYGKGQFRSFDSLSVGSVHLARSDKISSESFMTDAGQPTNFEEEDDESKYRSKI